MNKTAYILFATMLATASAWGASSSVGGETPTSVVMHPDTGSDGWGYRWIRSDEPGGPTFRWVDITTRGTLVSGLGDDNVVGPFDMLFNFRYYWYTVNQFKIGSNGYITFDMTWTAFAPPFAALPNTSLPNDLLAACVGDLDFTVAASNPRCYYWTNGLDSLVVSFIDVTEWQDVPTPNLRHTFQIILYKPDSSITYQYGVQQGRYNSPYNNRLCIGWEHATGQIGCSYTYSTTPPHALMPDSGLAIRIKRGNVNEEQWPDAGIVGGFDSQNLAKVMRAGVADTIRCVVKNYGTTSLTNFPVRYAITKAGQPSALDTVFVPSLAPSQQATVMFPRLFTPTVAGTYSALFNVTIPNDLGPGNNNKTAEILSASFGVGQSTLIRFEDGMEPGPPWAYTGGYGVAIDLPPVVYPVRVETVYVKTGNVFTQPMTVELFDGSSGSPGAMLATRTVTTIPLAMNAIVFTADNVVISGGRFFVCARGDIQFSYESTTPISYRAWEYVNGWIPHLSREYRDMVIRASVRGVTTDVKQVSDIMPDDVVLEQNYPNPFNPTTTVTYSLPSHSNNSAQGRVGVGSQVILKVFDLLGREVATLVNENQNPGTHTATWDASGQASGVYLYRLQAGGFVETKKLLLLR